MTTIPFAVDSLARKGGAFEIWVRASACPVSRTDGVFVVSSAKVFPLLLFAPYQLAVGEHLPDLTTVLFRADHLVPRLALERLGKSWKICQRAVDSEFW